MKKITMTLLTACAFSSIVYASKPSVENFYFTKGYEKGYQAGLLKGQKAAYEEAKKIVKKYKDQIHAYEIGKYLVEGSYVTAPEVYQKTSANGSGVEFVVLPSKIVKELSVTDIFEKFKNVPKIDESELTAANSQIEPDLNELNSVYLDLPPHALNSIGATPEQVSNNSVLHIAKTEKNRQLLQQAGVTYAENAADFEIVFFSTQEKKDFCADFKGLCR